MNSEDPISTNPVQYQILWENDFVRVLEYTDTPGVQTTPHQHPNSVMITLSAFDRRLSSGDRVVDVSLPAGEAVWLPAQRHSGHNTGTTPHPHDLCRAEGGRCGPAVGNRGWPGI